jgi:hypothetical protein
MNDTLVMCDSPSLLNKFGYSKMTNVMLWYNVEITIDGGKEICGPAQNFTYYKDVVMKSVVPSHGVLTGGTKVHLTGSGFNQEGGCN